MAVTMLLVLELTLTDSLAPAVPMASMPTLIWRRVATAVTTDTGGRSATLATGPHQARRHRADHRRPALALRLRIAQPPEHRAWIRK